MESLRSKYKRLEKWSKTTSDTLSGRSGVELVEMMDQLAEEKDAFIRDIKLVQPNAIDDQARTELAKMEETGMRIFNDTNKLLGEQLMEYNSKHCSPGQSTSQADASNQTEIDSTCPLTISTKPQQRDSEEITDLDQPDPLLQIIQTRSRSRIHPAAERHDDDNSTNSRIESAPQAETATTSAYTTYGRDAPQSAADGYYPKIDLRFDRVTLPTFNGDLIEWIPFRDQFIDLVHSNTNVTSLMKFHLLRSNLRDEALETISGYKFMSVNYESAWQDLNRRYNREDDLVEEYIKKFFELPVLSQTPSAGKYIQILNATNQMMRALPNWGIQVNSWDAWMKFIITSKLDEPTRRAWKTEIKRRQRVPLSELLEFIETRALETQTSQSEQFRQFIQPKGKTNPKKQSRSSVHLVTAGCGHCAGDHRIFRCPKFLELDAKKRSEIAKQLNLCLTCLISHDGKCKLGACPICSKKHNKLLCFRSMQPRSESTQQSTSQQ